MCSYLSGVANNFFLRRVLSIRAFNYYKKNPVFEVVNLPTQTCSFWFGVS